MKDGSPSRGEHLAVLALFAIALVLRVVHVHQYEERHPLADRPVIDERSYESWGREIARGDWMGDEVFFQEPLYPYWIGSVYAVLGEDRTALRYLQAGLGALTTVLVWALARRILGTGPAIVACFAFATYRPALLLPSLFLKENLFLPVIAGTALAMQRAFERTRDEGRIAPWCAVGVLAGIGALLRGNMLVLLPAFAASPLLAAWFGGAKRPRPARLLRAIPACIAVAFGCAAVLAPVAARNYHVGGVFALTTSGAGTNLYGGNNPDNPFGIAKEFDWVRGIPEYEAQDWRHEAERRTGRELTPTEVSSFWMTETLSSLGERPLLHLSILWNKLRLSLSSYEVPDNHHVDWDARFVPLLSLPIPGFGIWGWLSLAGMLAFLVSPRLRAGRDPSGPVLVALFFLAYLATIVLTVMSMRARIVLVPLLLPFGGWLVCALWGLRGDPRGAAPLLVALLLSGVAVFTPVFDREAREQKLAGRDYNLVTYLMEDGAPSDELLARVEDLDARYPNSLRVWSLRAEIDFRMAREAHAAGDGQRAKEHLRAARERVRTVIAESGSNARERHRAQVLGAELATFAGDARTAEELYRAALLFDPDDLNARRGLADALLVAAGRPEEVDFDRIHAAIAEYRNVLAEDAGDRAATLGLANALFLSSAGLTGADRTTAIGECERLLGELRAAGMPVDELLARVREAN